MIVCLSLTEFVSSVRKLSIPWKKFTSWTDSNWKVSICPGVKLMTELFWKREVEEVGFFADNTLREDPPLIDGDGSVWFTGNARSYSKAILVGGNTTKTKPPMYIIQCINSVPGSSSLYRITARGTGGTTDSVVILQSIYKRYWWLQPPIWMTFW